MSGSLFAVIILLFLGTGAIVLGVFYSIKALFYIADGTKKLIKGEKIKG